MTHFRHGARAPQYYYDKENYLDYIKEHWEIPGELTGVGERMHYLLGIRNRLRYIEDDNFLSKKFDPHEILIYSSPFNRTIISVSSQLQGLYPQYSSLGDNITDNQTSISKPQVNVEDERIQKEIDKLNISALPHSMMLAPVRMINNNERKITLYDIEPCTIKRDEIKIKNSKTIESLINITNIFNEDYGKTLNNFYGTKDEKYDMWFIDNFCDAFISAETHKRAMENLKKTGLSFEELSEFCFEFQKLNFRDWLNGDKNHVLAHLEVSKLMAEFIHYMDQRIKADINGERDLEKKYEDYSRPKMMMVSGHDSTVSCYEIFLMDAFNINILENYKYPKFATQIAFEITTSDDDNKNKTEEDYFINYYFNDELIFNKSVKDFKDKVIPHIWDDDKINEFCGFEEYKDDDNENIKEILIIVFISTTVIFLITTILLIIKLKKTKYSDNNKSYGASLLSKSND